MIFLFLVTTIAVFINCKGLIALEMSVGRNPGVTNGSAYSKSFFEPNENESWNKGPKELLPVVLECANDSNQLDEVNVGYVDFAEVIRIPWYLVNTTESSVKLLDILMDCACVGVQPKEAVIAPNEVTAGFIDYKQGTLGATKRYIIFRTSVGDRPLKIISTKIRDHYISPNVVHAKDSDITLEFNAVYLEGKGGPDFHIAGIEFDRSMLELASKRAMPACERLANGFDGPLVYDKRGSRLKFQIVSDCPIGRYESEIKITVTDDSNSLSDYTYCIPVFLSVMRGLEIEPSAITLGWVNRKRAKFPIVRQIKLTGLESRRIIDARIEPANDNIKTYVSKAHDDVAIIDVVIENIPPENNLKAYLKFLLAQDEPVRSERVIIPIFGIFR